MYNVSQGYKHKIGNLDRVFDIEIRIEHSKGTLVLGNKDIGQGSFKYRDGSQAGDEFTVGGTVASDIEFTLVRKEEYDDINFIGARVVPTIKFELEKGVDAHFIQPSQPSKMLGSDEEWEFVPMGQFNIDIADRKRSTINIKGIDNMVELDKPYALSKLSYPASLYQIYVDICNVADVSVGTLSFTNQTYIVQSRPSGDLSLRNVLGFVAELSGSFAKFNKLGGLELRWYENSGMTLTPQQRSSLEMGDSEIQITGVAVESDEEDSEGNKIMYLTGTDDYTINLTGNELLQGNYESVLPDILDKIGSTIFIPYTANFNGNPALESGDIVAQIDIDGNAYSSVITHLEYKYRGTSKIDGKALPNIVRGFQSTDNRIASIINRVEKEVGDKLTGLEEAQLQATELIGNMLGGYVTEVKYDTDPNFARFGIGVFIHDTKVLANSTKIWKWGLGGFGYSDDGGLTYTTGITANGSIVAELISAGIITANMVQTGILQANNGKSYFDLDNGILRISHGGTEYSQMDINGFGMKGAYGTSYYLNDITVLSGSTPMGSHSERDESIWTSTVRIPLDARFRGKDIEPYVTLRSYNLPVPLDDNIQFGIADIETFLRVVASNTSISNPSPYVEVRGYSRWTGYLLGSPAYYYRNLDFQLMVVAK